jgi:hypothetical protein
MQNQLFYKNADGIFETTQIPFSAFEVDVPKITKPIVLKDATPDEKLYKIAATVEEKEKFIQLARNSLNNEAKPIILKPLFNERLKTSDEISTIQTKKKLEYSLTTFNINDTENINHYFNHYGIVCIKDVLNKEQIQERINSAWDAVESVPRLEQYKISRTAPMQTLKNLWIPPYCPELYNLNWEEIQRPDIVNVAKTLCPKRELKESEEPKTPRSNLQLPQLTAIPNKIDIILQGKSSNSAKTNVNNLIGKIALNPFRFTFVPFSHLEANNRKIMLMSGNELTVMYRDRAITVEVPEGCLMFYSSRLLHKSIHNCKRTPTLIENISYTNLLTSAYINSHKEGTMPESYPEGKLIPDYISEAHARITPPQYYSLQLRGSKHFLVMNYKRENYKPPILSELGKQLCGYNYSLCVDEPDYSLKTEIKDEKKKSFIKNINDEINMISLSDLSNERAHLIKNLYYNLGIINSLDINKKLTKDIFENLLPWFIMNYDVYRKHFGTKKMIPFTATEMVRSVRSVIRKWSGGELRHDKKEDFYSICFNTKMTPIICECFGTNRVQLRCL